jgi:hypothetical protein
MGDSRLSDAELIRRLHANPSLRERVVALLYAEDTVENLPAAFLEPWLAKNLNSHFPYNTYLAELTENLCWTVAHVGAAEGYLPSDFADWTLPDDRGWTVAHVAMMHGHLPASFEDWALKNPHNGVTLAHMAIIAGRVPTGFRQWKIQDGQGWSVAHVAASCGCLPSDLDLLSIQNPENGRTVAHIAAQMGQLPPDFDGWYWQDKAGWSVAHIAAANGSLSLRFDQWHLANEKNTLTVAHVAAANGHLPPHFTQWKLSTQEGWTVTHIAAQKAERDGWKASDEKTPPELEWTWSP